MTQGPSAGPGPGPSMRDKLGERALVALLVVVALGVSLVLPPFANEQFVASVDQLRKPLIGLLVAVTLFAVSAWRRRVPLAALAVIVLFIGVQGAYFYVTTDTWRRAVTESRAWTRVPLADAAKGVAANEENVFGSAKLRWRDDDIDLSLSSKIGTTQQGFYMDAARGGANYAFSARVGGAVGARSSTCPLLFGIRNTRDYYTFRLQRNDRNEILAYVYHIVPNDPQVLTSGFHGVLQLESERLVFVFHWNVIRPWEGKQVRLGITAHGPTYRFFVNDRQVGSATKEIEAPRIVAVGVTVLNNGGFDDTDCHFSDVQLWSGT